MPPPYRGVLFDLFGTLVRFDPTRLPHLVRDGVRVPSTLAALGPLLDDVAPGVGAERLFDALMAVSRELVAERAHDHREQPSRERFRRALERVGVAAPAAAAGGVLLSRAHLALLVAATDYPPSHRAVVERVARNRRLAIVSNFDDTAAAYEVLHRHGILDGLHAIVVSEAVGVRKPHELIMRQALGRLELPAGDVVFVGDTFAEDVLGAQHAGIDVAWIDRDGTGVPAGQTAPTWVLRRLEELPAALDP